MQSKIDIAWIDPGYVHGEFARSIATAASDMEYFGCLGEIHQMGVSLPAAGRNVVTRVFLEGDSDWLWWVDGDMLFDKGHVMKLWNTAQDHDAKIVSGMAFMFFNHQEPVPSYFMWGDGKFYGEDTLYIPKNVVPEEPMEVAATGFASVLVHREVFEAMEPARHPDYRWFDQIDIGQEELSGEDTQFFVRAAEIGYKTILDPNAETIHIKEIGVGKDAWKRHHELQGTATWEPS